MGAIRTLLAASNVAEAFTFIWTDAVLWSQCLVMLGGGVHFAQKADPKKMRYAVIRAGLLMNAYFLIRGR